MLTSALAATQAPLDGPGQFVVYEHQRWRAGGGRGGWSAEHLDPATDLPSYWAPAYSLSMEALVDSCPVIDAKFMPHEGWRIVELVDMPCDSDGWSYAEAFADFDDAGGGTVLPFFSHNLPVRRRAHVRAIVPATDQFIKGPAATAERTAAAVAAAASATAGASAVVKAGAAAVGRIATNVTTGVRLPEIPYTVIFSVNSVSLQAKFPSDVTVHELKTWAEESVHELVNSVTIRIDAVLMGDTDVGLTDSIKELTRASRRGRGGNAAGGSGTAGAGGAGGASGFRGGLDSIQRRIRFQAAKVVVSLHVRGPSGLAFSHDVRSKLLKVARVVRSSTHPRGGSLEAENVLVDLIPRGMALIRVDDLRLADRNVAHMQVLDYLDEHLGATKTLVLARISSAADLQTTIDDAFKTGNSNNSHSKQSTNGSAVQAAVPLASGGAGTGTAAPPLPVPPAAMSISSSGSAARADMEEEEEVTTPRRTQVHSSSMSAPRARRGSASFAVGTDTESATKASTVPVAKSPFVLHLAVLGATKLSVQDPLLAAPYVVVYVNQQFCGRTATKRGTVNPEWNETFNAPMLHLGGNITLEVFHSDLARQDTLLGTAEMPSGELRIDGEVTRSFPIGRGKGALQCQFMLHTQPVVWIEREHVEGTMTLRRLGPNAAPKHLANSKFAEGRRCARVLSHLARGTVYTQQCSDQLLEWASRSLTEQGEAPLVLDVVRDVSHVILPHTPLLVPGTDPWLMSAGPTAHASVDGSGTAATGGAISGSDNGSVQDRADPEADPDAPRDGGNSLGSLPRGSDFTHLSSIAVHGGINTTLENILMWHPFDWENARDGVPNFAGVCPATTAIGVAGLSGTFAAGASSNTATREKLANNANGELHDRPSVGNLMLEQSTLTDMLRSSELANVGATLSNAFAGSVLESCAKTTPHNPLNSDLFSRNTPTFRNAKLPPLTVELQLNPYERGHVPWVVRITCATQSSYLRLVDALTRWIVIASPACEGGRAILDEFDTLVEVPNLVVDVAPMEFSEDTKEDTSEEAIFVRNEAKDASAADDTASSSSSSSAAGAPPGATRPPRFLGAVTQARCHASVDIANDQCRVIVDRKSAAVASLARAYVRCLVLGDEGTLTSDHLLVLFVRLPEDRSRRQRLLRTIAPTGTVRELENPDMRETGAGAQPDVVVVKKTVLYCTVRLGEWFATVPLTIEPPSDDVLEALSRQPSGLAVPEEDSVNHGMEDGDLSTAAAEDGFVDFSSFSFPVPIMLPVDEATLAASSAANRAREQRERARKIQQERDQVAERTTGEEFSYTSRNAAPSDAGSPTFASASTHTSAHRKRDSATTSETVHLLAQSVMRELRVELSHSPPSSLTAARNATTDPSSSAAGGGGTSDARGASAPAAGGPDSAAAGAGGTGVGGAGPAGDAFVNITKSDLGVRQPGKSIYGGTLPFEQVQTNPLSTEWTSLPINSTVRRLRVVVESAQNLGLKKKNCYCNLYLGTFPDAILDHTKQKTRSDVSAKWGEAFSYEDCPGDDLDLSACDFLLVKVKYGSGGLIKRGQNVLGTVRIPLKTLPSAPEPTKFAIELADEFIQLQGRQRGRPGAQATEKPTLRVICFWDASLPVGTHAAAKAAAEAMGTRAGAALALGPGGVDSGLVVGAQAPELEIDVSWRYETATAQNCGWPCRVFECFDDVAGGGGAAQGHVGGAAPMSSVTTTANAATPASASVGGGPSMSAWECNLLLDARAHAAMAVSCSDTELLTDSILTSTVEPPRGAAAAATPQTPSTAAGLASGEAGDASETRTIGADAGTGAGSASRPPGRAQRRGSKVGGGILRGMGRSLPTAEMCGPLTDGLGDCVGTWYDSRQLNHTCDFMCSVHAVSLPEYLLLAKPFGDLRGAYKSVPVGLFNNPRTVEIARAEPLFGSAQRVASLASRMVNIQLSSRMRRDAEKARAGRSAAYVAPTTGAGGAPSHTPTSSGVSAVSSSASAATAVGRRNWVMNIRSWFASRLMRRLDAQYREHYNSHRARFATVSSDTAKASDGQGAASSELPEELCGPPVDNLRMPWCGRVSYRDIRGVAIVSPTSVRVDVEVREPGQPRHFVTLLIGPLASSTQFADLLEQRMALTQVRTDLVSLATATRAQMEAEGKVRARQGSQAASPTVGTSIAARPSSIPVIDARTLARAEERTTALASTIVGELVRASRELQDLAAILSPVSDETVLDDDLRPDADATLKRVDMRRGRARVVSENQEAEQLAPATVINETGPSPTAATRPSRGRSGGARGSLVRNKRMTGALVGHKRTMTISSRVGMLGSDIRRQFRLTALLNERISRLRAYIQLVRGLRVPTHIADDPTRYQQEVIQRLNQFDDVRSVVLREDEPMDVSLIRTAVEEMIALLGVELRKVIVGSWELEGAAQRQRQRGQHSVIMQNHLSTAINTVYLRVVELLGSVVMSDRLMERVKGHADRVALIIFVLQQDDAIDRVVTPYLSVLAFSTSDPPLLSSVIDKRALIRRYRGALESEMKEWCNKVLASHLRAGQQQGAYVAGRAGAANRATASAAAGEGKTERVKSLMRSTMAGLRNSESDDPGAAVGGESSPLSVASRTASGTAGNGGVSTQALYAPPWEVHGGASSKSGTGGATEPGLVFRDIANASNPEELAAAVVATGSGGSNKPYTAVFEDILMALRNYVSLVSAGGDVSSLESSTRKEVRATEPIRVLTSAVAISNLQELQRTVMYCMASALVHLASAVTAALSTRPWWHFADQPASSSDHELGDIIVFLCALINDCARMSSHHMDQLEVDMQALEGMESSAHTMLVRDAFTDLAMRATERLHAIIVSDLRELLGEDTFTEAWQNREDPIKQVCLTLLDYFDDFGQWLDLFFSRKLVLLCVDTVVIRYLHFLRGFVDSRQNFTRSDVLQMRIDVVDLHQTFVAMVNNETNLAKLDGGGGGIALFSENAAGLLGFRSLGGSLVGRKMRCLADMFNLLQLPADPNLENPDISTIFVLPGNDAAGFDESQAKLIGYFSMLLADNQDCAAALCNMLECVLHLRGEFQTTDPVWGLARGTFSSGNDTAPYTSGSSATTADIWKSVFGLSMEQREQLRQSKRGDVLSVALQPGAWQTKLTRFLEKGEAIAGDTRAVMQRELNKHRGLATPSEADVVRREGPGGGVTEIEVQSRAGAHEWRFEVKLEVLEARALPAEIQKLGKPATYCQIQVGSYHVQTDIVHFSAAPRWSQMFRFPLENLLGLEAYVDLYRWRRLHKNQCLGHVRIPLGGVGAESQEGWHTLATKSSTAAATAAGETVRPASMTNPQLRIRISVVELAAA